MLCFPKKINNTRTTIIPIIANVINLHKTFYNDFKNYTQFSVFHIIKDRYRKAIVLCDESFSDVIIFKLRSDRLSVCKLQFGGRLKSDKRLSGGRRIPILFLTCCGFEQKWNENLLFLKTQFSYLVQGGLYICGWVR